MCEDWCLLQNKIGKGGGWKYTRNRIAHEPKPEMPVDFNILPALVGCVLLEIPYSKLPKNKNTTSPFNPAIQK